MPPSNNEIKAALNPGFEFNPDSSQTYDEQLEVHRYPLKQLLQQQEYAGQHDPYLSGLSPDENDTNTAKAIRAAAGVSDVDPNVILRDKLNDPNTPDVERLELYDQLESKEARQKFDRKFPGLLPEPSIPTARVDSVLFAKERQAASFSARVQAKKQNILLIKKESALAIAKAKFQQQPTPAIQSNVFPRQPNPAIQPREAPLSAPNVQPTPVVQSAGVQRTAAPVSPVQNVPTTDNSTKEELLDAIYVAEGEDKARVAYGQTEYFKTRLANGEEIPEAEARNAASTMLTRHIDLWEANKSRAVDNAEARGLVNANPTKAKAIQNNQFSPEFLTWYGEIYAPSAVSNTTLSDSEKALNPNWVANVTSNLDQEQVAAYAPADVIEDTPQIPTVGNLQIPTENDLGSLVSEDALSLTQLSDELTKASGSSSLLDDLAAPNYMPTAPVEKSNGRVAKHVDGSWSVTVANGQVLPGLDEVTAKSFSAYNLADEIAQSKGAPAGTLGTLSNLFMQSWAIPVEMAAAAFTGPITLSEKVGDWNKGMLEGQKNPISDSAIVAFRAGTLPEKHPRFKVLTRLNAEALENNKQFQSIKEEADLYRDEFPVNDKDYRGATAAYDVISKNQGNMAAIWNAVSNDPGAYIEQGVGSIGFMIALTVGGPPVQLAILSTLAKGRANQGIDEFTKREKRDPTAEERFRIKWASAAGLVAEKISAGIVVKTIGKTLPGSQTLWAQKVVKNVRESTPSKIANLKVIQPVIGIGSEASQGAATSFFEQYAQTGTVDADKVIFDAFQEGIATPGAAGGMIATNLAYQTGKGIGKKVIGYDKITNKKNLQNNLADIEAKLADINKRERLASISAENGVFSQAADQEKQSLDPLKRTQFKETQAATDLQKELKKVQSQLKAIEETGKAAGEQLELNLGDETTLPQSSAAKEEFRDLENKETELNKTLDAFVSPEIEEQIQANAKQALEQARDSYKTILASGKFSTKAIRNTIKDIDEAAKIDPDVGKSITDADFTSVLDDLGIVQSKSSLQKLKDVAKRGLTPEQKTKVRAVLDKSLDKVLDAGETAFSIFGSNFLEGALDSDNLTDAQLKAEQDKAPTSQDRLTIQKIRDLKEAKRLLENESDSTIDKSLEEVDKEVLEGQSARWKGIDTYRKEILAELKKQDAAEESAKRRYDLPINNLVAKLRNHAGNLQRKYTTFKKAQAAYNKLSDLEKATGKGIIVVGKNVSSDRTIRKMEYTISTEIDSTEAEFKKAREAGLASIKSDQRQYVFRIGADSTTLINTLENEAKFGNAAIGLIDSYKNTSYNTSLEEQKSKRLANEELDAELKSISLDLTEPEKAATVEEIAAVELETDADPIADKTPEVDPVEDELSVEQKRIAELEERVNALETQLKDQSGVGTETGQSKPETPTPSETITAAASNDESVESRVDEDGNILGEETPFRPNEFEERSDSSSEETESDTENENNTSPTLKGALRESRSTAGSQSKNLDGKTLFKDAAKNILGIFGALSRSVLDFISINDKENGLNTLTDADFTNAQTLSRALQALEISKETANILSNRYFTDFKLRYDKIASSVSQPATAFRRPLTIFMRTNAEGKDELPNQVLFALMLTTLGRAQQHPDNKTFRNKQEREKFLSGGRNNLKSNDYDQLANLGADYTQTINSLGKQAIAILKIKKKFNPKAPVKPEAAELYYQNLGVALGITAVQIAETEIEGKDRLFSIEVHTFKFENSRANGDRFKSGDTYRHIVTNEQTGLTKGEIKALKEVHEANDSKLNPSDHIPLQAPPKDIAADHRIQNTLTSIPLKVRAILSKLQNTPWKAAESMDIFSKLATNGYKEVLYTLAGYQEFNPETRMRKEVESLTSQNSDKTTAIDEVLQAYEDGHLKNFYFSYELQKHQRVMMQGRINPQNSKVTRFLLSSWGAATYTAANIWKFKLGVAQNLGVKVDKKDFKTAALEFDNIINDPLIQEAVKAISDLNIATSKEDQKGPSKKLAELLPQIQGKYKVEHGTSIINALTGLSQYKPGKKFKSDLVMEIDGISNGWAMTVLQFPMFDTNLEQIFAQVGIYFGENPKHDTGQEDAYQTLVKHLKSFTDSATAWKYYTERSNIDAGNKKDAELSEELKAEEKSHKAAYQSKSDALNQLYPDLKNGDLRTFVKYPFLIYMYGGGIDEISQGVAGDIVTSIYAQLGQMQREYNEMKGNTELSESLKDDLEARKILARTAEDYITEVVSPYFKNLNALNIVDNSIKQAFVSETTNIYDISLNDEALQNSIAATLAPRFNYALDAMLGATKDARNAVTQMGSILHAVFQAHYDKAYNEALQLRDSDGKVVGKRGSLTRSEINKLILDENNKLMEVYPAYRGPLAEINEKIIDGGVDLTERIYDVSTKTDDTVVQDFTIDGKNTDVTSSPSSIKFAAPGVSALIRQIINMDSVLLSLTLDAHPDLLMLHDAFMGTPEQLVEVAKEYNEHYLRLGMEHSVIEETYQRVIDVIETAKNNNLMPQVETYLKKEDKFGRGYRAMMFRSSKAETPIEQDKSIFEVVKRVRAARAKLQKKIKDNKGLISAFQMYMPTEELIDTAKSFYESLLGKVRANLEEVTTVTKTRKKVFYTGADIDVLNDGILTAIAKLGGIAKFSSEKSGTRKLQFGDFGLDKDPTYRSAPSGLGTGWPAFRVNSGGTDVDNMRTLLEGYGYLTDSNNTEEIFDKVKEEIANPENKQKTTAGIAADVQNTDYEAGFEQYYRDLEENGQLDELKSLEELPETQDTPTNTDTTFWEDLDSFLEGLNSDQQNAIENLDRFEGTSTVMGYINNPESLKKEIDNTAVGTSESAMNEDNEFDENAVIDAGRVILYDILINKFKSLDGLPTSDPKIKLESALNLDTIKQLFSTMKTASVNYYNSKTDMDNHTSVLENVLDILGKGLTETSNLSLTLEQIDGITQGTYETARNKVTVSVARQTPPSINGQSPQEVYAHELVHAMTWQAINDSPLVADNIAALYRQVEADLNTNPKFKGQPWRVFIPAGRTKASANEIATAKQQYKYLFDNPKQESHKLHEFLAYAVTNRQMVEYLQTQPSALRKDFIGKFMRAIELVVNIFKRVFGKAYSRKADQNGFEQMLAVTEHLVAIQSKHQSKVQQLQSKTYNFLDETDKKLKQFAFEKSVELMKVDSTVGKARLVVAGTVASAVHTLSDNATSKRLRNRVNLVLGKTLRGVANEIGGGALSESMIEQLLHAKVNVSKARQEAERASIHWFTGHKKENRDGIWKSVDPEDNHSMSVELKEALTDVLFRTDLSSLIGAGFSHAGIADLIGDTTAINNAEKQIKIRLRRIQSKGFKSAIRYAEELGYHMATGKTKLREAHMNAHTIAFEYFENPTTEQISLLDAYATLEALKEIDPNKASDVKALAVNEFRADIKQNGIIDMIDSHLFYKEDSLNGLFNGNPTQMVKGYIIERVDDLTSMKVGTAADVEKMKREGYFESYPLGKVDSKQTYDTLYISRHMPEVADVSGILSTTNQRNMGTTLTEIFMRDPAYQVNGKPDFVLIKQKVKTFIKDQGKKSSNTFLKEDKSFKLRPIRDETGRITDYRVMMDHASRKKIIRPDLEIQNVFAHMNSSLVDRQATLVNNIATIDLLVDEQLDLMESHPREFTDLLDPKGAYIERYYKLPKAVRDYITAYSTNGTFMVRVDIIDKVFGYKAFDITQLQVLAKHPRVRYVAGLAHYIMRQIVGYGKDRIVIAMPNVIINNLFSNISQLSMRKIPISYTFYKIIEGVSEYKKYRTATEQRHRLQQLINSKNLSKTSTEQQQVDRLTAQIQNNKLHKMSEAGLNSLIVEDVNDAQTDGYFNRMRRMLRLESFKYKDYTDRVPKNVGTVASWLFFTKSSKPYQASRHVVQMTDFLGRYVMIEHATKVHNKDFKTAMHEALNAFVLFDEALVPALEAVDAIGATSFLSYFLRNQRASKQLAEASPTSVALSAAVQHLTGIPTLGNVNASWLSGDFSPNTLQFDDLLDEANNATGIEILAWFKGLFS